MTKTTNKNLVRHILLLVVSCAFFLQSNAQTAYWSKVETYPGFNAPYFIKYQDKKGLWSAGPNGIDFTDIKTKKITPYTTDAEGKDLGFIRDIAVFNNSVYACNKDVVYALNAATNKFTAYTIPAAAAYNQWKLLYATDNGIMVGGDKSCVLIEDQKPVVMNYPNRVTKLSDATLPFFGFTFGNSFLYSLGTMQGIFMTDKSAKTDLAIFTTDNVEAGFYEPGKGVWMKNSDNILFVSTDAGLKLTTALRNFPEKIEKMLQAANGSVLLYSKKNVYELRVEGTAGQAAIKYTLSKEWSPLAYALEKAPVALGNNGEIFYANNYGVYQQKGPSITALVTNPSPIAFVSYWNWLMPDGNFYALDGQELYIFTGKGAVKKTSSAGHGSNLATDGKNIYMGAGNRILKKNAVANFETMAELPINFGTKITTATDGKVYFAGKDGIGYVQQGKVHFTKAADISGFPYASIQSIAVNNKNEVLIFADSMYRYANNKTTAVEGTKMLLYKHYFDNKGGQYSSDGSNKGFYLKTNKTVPLTDMIREKFALPQSDYIGVGDIVMDYKGRVWLVGNYQKKRFLHLIDDGKVIARFDETEMPLLSSTSTYLFCNQKKLYILSTSKGMMVYDLN